MFNKRSIGSEIVLFGISYDKGAPGSDRKHTCKMIKV